MIKRQMTITILTTDQHQTYSQLSPSSMLRQWWEKLQLD